MFRRLATGASAFSTFFQSFPRLVPIIRRMRPTWHVPALSAVDEQFIRTHGIRGMIWDVDGTLTGDRRPTLEPEAAAPFEALMTMPGLKHVVLSNSGEERFRELGTIFPRLPILRAYSRGDQLLFRRLQGTSDSWTSSELEQQLAAGARMIRKPHKALVDYALRELSLEPGAVVMIGDQYMTDVAGANYGGVRSIKLPTIAAHTFRRSVKLSQKLEKLVFAVVHGRSRS